MTKEELNKQANDFIKNKICDSDDYSCGYLPSTVEEMLVDFATETTKELQAQIEKMKCCGNCKHFVFLDELGYRTCIKDGKDEGKMKKTMKKIFIKFLRVLLLTVSFPFMVLVFGIGIYCKCFVDLIMDKPLEE